MPGSFDGATLFQLAYNVFASSLGQNTTRTFYNPYGMTAAASGYGRTTVSQPGDTPSTYGYGQNPLPTDGVLVTNERGEQAVRYPDGSIGSTEGLVDVGSPTIVDQVREWLGQAVPRVGVFILGALLIVLALYLLVRGNSNGIKITNVIQTTPAPKKASAGPTLKASKKRAAAPAPAQSNANASVSASEPPKLIEFKPS